MIPNHITLDLVLAVVLVVFVVWGLLQGLIRVVGGILSLVVALILARQFDEMLAQYIGPWFGNFSWLASAISFLVIFVLASSIFKYLVELANRTFTMLAIIPFFKTINRLLGAVVALVFGVVLLGSVLFLVIRYAPTDATQQRVKESWLAQSILKSSEIFWPYLPQDWASLSSLGTVNVQTTLPFPVLPPHENQ